MIRIGINGFGRIGRTLFRLISERDDLEIVHVNDIHPLKTLLHLVKYDSIHGKFDKSLTYVQDDLFLMEDQEVTYSKCSDISKLSWGNVDVVFEATGKYKIKADLDHHIKNGADKVILTVPPADESMKMIVMGVNEHLLSKEDEIFSNASCTTNSAAHLIKIVSENYKLDSCFITTVHSYTADQNLHDAPHKDLRRARGAVQSIIPTTTGAAKALTRIFPELADKLGGCGIRVPVPDGSLTDITFTINNPPSADEINQLVKLSSENDFKGFVQFSTDPLVSADIIGNPHSCVFDSGLTSVVGNMLKVVGWYDNEIGYSNRLIDLLDFHDSL
ncbi:MAG: type I glyceraldehyde-3-phosphate dehydrogenase [Flavobacteriales bacterium]|jgi:glyceraldehyde 3-phosphate dehydrogenase|tara:strand:- start:411 stop:1403 length:993 start_codon:yes stop_codon:yes gene_type:complete